MMSFDQILSGLKEVKASPRVEDPEEEEAAEAPKKKRKEKEGKGKKKEKEKKETKKKAEEEEEAAKTKLATHVGRYHKRENAKRVRAYSSQDLAAILGSVPGGSPAVAEEDGPFMKEVRADVQEDSDASSSGHLSDEEQTAPASKKIKSSPKDEVEVEEAPLVKSWWMGLFVKAGRMGSTKKELKSKKVTAAKAARVGFSEKDQENLYSDAHTHATHGKQGLGIGDAPKKVAGARWQGTKTKLTDSDDEEEAVEEDEEASSEEEDTGIVVLSAKQPAQVPSLKFQLPEKGGKVKKSKGESPDFEALAISILKAEKKRSLNLKVLKSRVLEAAGLEEGGKKVVKAIKANAGLFQIVDKKVTLATRL